MPRLQRHGVGAVTTWARRRHTLAGGWLVYPAHHDPHGCDRPGCTAARNGSSPWCDDHQPEVRP